MKWRMRRGARNEKRPREGAFPEFFRRIGMRGLESLQVHGGLLAVAAGLELVGDLLALAEGRQARPLDGRDVDESVLATADRLDKAKALGGVEEFHGAFSHSDDPLKRRFPAGDMPVPATFVHFSGDQRTGEPDRQQRETVAKRMESICALSSRIATATIQD